ncbi:TRAP transporter small permease [Sutcliffiella horikoshii]|uniref:TRAP transporter small permease n=1 Tax=Sutcliffiella horikoshii TaxID=79883 RepID=UPI001CBC3F75|nr:TRAP transporter small permease [Sutcliffiella horikoshii]UAL45960.1 TRAP transporter small permease [Sutcliffiella horikoshii]
MMKISDGIAKVEKFLGAFLMLCMAVIITLSVAFRYFLNSPLSWAGEVSIFLLIWISFIGGSLGLKYKSQASVSIFLEYVPTNISKVLTLIGHICMLLFLLVILYYTYTWILSPNVALQKSSGILLPMWIPYSAVPIGLTCAAFHILTNFLVVFREGEVE